MSRLSLSLVGLVALGATSGCWGSRSYVAADGAKYPVSMSSAVRGPDGHVLTADQLDTKAQFATDYMTCRMLWTLIPLKTLWTSEDISDEINQQVKAVGGEAIVNLTVESGATVWTIMTLVGVLPDCGKVHIKGDIVARKPAPQPAPAPQPTAPMPAAAQPAAALPAAPQPAT